MGKLTSEDAAHIFLEKYCGISQKATARRFSTSQTVVSKIQRGLIYRHATLCFDTEVTNATLISLAFTGAA